MVGLRWYRKAAEAGNSSGMNNLGAMYEQGRGVVQDTQQAIVWYEKAVAAGHSVAPDNLKRLRGQ